MRFAPALTATLVLAAVGVHASADDAPKTYKVVLRDHWKAGDVVTRSGTEKEHTAVRVVTTEGVEVQNSVVDKVTTYVWVAKCVDVDAQAHVTKGLAYASSWSMVAGEEKDKSIEGVVVEFSGVGAARTWKITTPGAEPTEAAKQWIEKQVGPTSRRDEVDELTQPPKEVAVGESWTPDMVALSKALGSRVPVDSAKATGKAALEKVEASTAAVTRHIELPTNGLPDPRSGQTFPWTEGGVLVVDTRYVKPLDGSTGPGKGSGDVAWKGLADATAAKIEFAFAQHTEASSKAGGEIPAAPAAPVAPADPVKPPAPGEPAGPMPGK